MQSPGERFSFILLICVSIPVAALMVYLAIDGIRNQIARRHRRRRPNHHSH
ncbi:MAG: hypothetical protein ACO34E_11945 [Limisphaerales bacterium]